MFPIFHPIEEKKSLDSAAKIKMKFNRVHLEFQRHLINVLKTKANYRPRHYFDRMKNSINTLMLPTLIAENYRPSSSRVLLPFLMLHAQRVFDLLTAWCVFDYKWCLVRWSLFANGKTKSQFDLIKRSDEGSSYESMDINKQDIWMTHAFDSGGGGGRESTKRIPNGPNVKDARKKVRPSSS